MEQVLLRVFDVDFRAFYGKFRDAQGEAFMTLMPPGAWQVNAPAVSARMTAQAGVYAFLYVGLGDKTICILELRQPLYEMEAPSTIVRLYWEPEAANFASGFLDWLRGNFNTDAPQPLTGEEQKRLRQLKEWAGSGKLKRELAEEMGLTERQLARVAKDLAAKGYVTDYYLADRNKSGNVR